MELHNILGLFSNQVLLCCITAWFVAQALKIPTYYLVEKKWDWHRFFGSGGMPSSHTAFVVSLTLMIGATQGFDSAIFALSFTMAAIVMYDATGVRRETGKQAVIINEIVQKMFVTQLMNSYYNGLITNEEVIKELLKTAEEIANLYKNGQKLGLSQEELAFYDALTKPEHIKDFYKNDELIALTRELTEMLRKNRTIDWQKKETARAQMRKMVKRLLKKYKYPPEDYDFAISTVISQCELWTDNVEPQKEETLYKYVSETELSMVAANTFPYGEKK